MFLLRRRGPHEGTLPSDAFMTTLSSRLDQGSRRSPLTNSQARPTPHNAPVPGRKQVKFAEAANNLPVVAESNARGRWLAIKEDQGPSGVEEDPLAEVDLAALDEATGGRVV